MRAHYRTLFVDESGESKRAAEKLKETGIAFSLAQVEPSSGEFNVLPALIGSEGEWRGIAEIEKFVSLRKHRR